MRSKPHDAKAGKEYDGKQKEVHKLQLIVEKEEPLFYCWFFVFPAKSPPRFVLVRGLNIRGVPGANLRDKFCYTNYPGFVNNFDPGFVSMFTLTWDP